jgi:hypothetical protein
MFKDPIVEEVRDARQKHAARFNYDLRKIAEDLRMKEQKSGRKIVSFLPKPAKKTDIRTYTQKKPLTRSNADGRILAANRIVKGITRTGSSHP